MMTNNREKLKQQIESDRGWYFIGFSCELPPNRPYGFTLFNKPFVLFKDNNDKLVCYSLSSLDETQKEERAKVRSFEVIQKQGEIWFWRGKT